MNRRAIERIPVFVLAAPSVLLLCFTASPALAEVSDKFPPATRLWFEAIVFACLAFLGVRIRWWLPGALLPLAALIGIARVAEMRDPFVRPAIWAEQGWPYATTLYGSTALLIAVPMVALWAGYRGQRSGRAKHV